MKILVLNAGSSTLKFSLFAVTPDEAGEQASGMIDWSDGTRPTQAHLTAQGVPGDIHLTWEVPADRHDAGVAEVLAALARPDPPLIGSPAEIAAVGHRVVHGGTTYRESVRIDAAVQAEIGRLAALAPLHNPPALAGIEAAQRALPGVPQVAVFDTAFHATLPPEAYIYPVPYAWYSDWGIRRFGFHGISHAYCAGRAAEVLGRPLAELRLVTCHLGNGCSLAAIAGGHSVDTTMGFTPLEGLMMGTRPGSVDPGVLLYVQQQHGLSAAALDDILNHQSGLLGISGVSSDMRAVEAAAKEGQERAVLALTLFAARARAGIAAMTAALGGLDALVFTAGIGEHAVAMRAAICERLGFMGVTIDPQRNTPAAVDQDIALAGAAVHVLVIHTQEDLLIARETARVLGTA
jgi:acetate kinase